jgi:glycerol-3-phosphate cytidylyltransferase
MDKNFTGRDYCEQKGIEIYYNSRDHRFSSSGLRKHVKEIEENE